MLDTNTVEQICLIIEEISSYVGNLLCAQTYEDNICYLMGLLSDVEQVLVKIANIRAALTDNM